MAGCAPSLPIDEDFERLTISEVDSNPSSSPVITPTGQLPMYKNDHDYFMHHTNRGKCVVFNHEYFPHLNQRRGTHHDVDRINRTFKRLGFAVEVCNDYEHDAIKDRIKKLSEEDHSENDCLVIIVLTHGEDDRKIHARDVPYDMKDLWKYFTADKCISLAGKPKLFFFSACRGQRRDKGVVLEIIERTETDGSKAYAIPTEADFLFGFSTPPGYVSHREPTNGTWYIKSLCAVLDKYAATNDLLEMLTKTTREVTKFKDESVFPCRKQVPEFHSRLSRRVFLKPRERTE